ncbi:MAG: serine/threonine protein phosphatase [Bdellovibrionales bacterium]|nr:serine/threonine protein phosphatase [Bdellovibrionales bacterium]
MKRKKIYLAVGDVHGCWRELDLLLQKLGQQYDLESPDVQMVFLGDYIDRGDSSLRVLDRLLSVKKTFPDTILLKGNHELLFLENGYRDENDLPAVLATETVEFLKV